MTLLETPLTQLHRQAGAKLVDFAGFAMPIDFGTGIRNEHQAVRESCGIFDVSHMGTLWLEGEGALAAADEVLTNDIAGLEENAIQYTLQCNDRGGVVDDMLVARLGPGSALVVPNAANVAAVRDALTDSIEDGGLADESLETAIIAVQGPRSGDVLASLSLNPDMPYMSVGTGSFAGRSIHVARSGYTGERGYELFVPAEIAESLWQSLAQDERVTRCGLGARDTLRLEMGYPLSGQDLSEDITPLEAGLGWAVAWEKDHFDGKEALVAQRQRGVDRRLQGLLLSDRGVPRPGMSVAEGGHLTSGTFSPTLQRGIALALLPESLGRGQQVHVQMRGREIAAEVVKPPFVERSPR
ncbi:MAG: glycine cleavage system aminomethyltransferase GcvT [Actinobacteria bacterium]|nr:glycine cleavage system aminomethyltransferase GcvT [Actinomycetota bacterium]